MTTHTKLLALLLFFFFIQLYAQIPEKIGYQAVIRDAGGAIIVNQPINLQVSILKGSVSGTIEYAETHNSTTNENGLVTVEIGNGSLISGDFTTINWSNDSYFIQVDVDVNGGANYTISSTNQLLSVPYSLHAKTATIAQNGLPNGNSNAEILFWDGTNWQQLPLGNHGESLYNCNGQLTWGNGCSPIVETFEPTNVWSSSVTLSGDVLDQGNGAVLTKGICFSLSPNPTISDNNFDLGNGLGSFNVDVDNLQISTVYYVRAYAINDNGISYGNEVKFTTLTPDLPTMTIDEISNITFNSAVSGGDILDDGNGTIITKGLCYSTSPNPTTSDFLTDNGSGLGAFTSNITANVFASTTYYVRAYATNESGTGYSEELSFTTLAPVLATITTNDISDFSATTVTGGGNISNNGGAEVTARGVCYSTSSNPTLADNFTTDSSGIGTFSSQITGLTASTIYYVRAYSTNSVGTAYGNEVSFLSGVTDVGDIYEGGIVFYLTNNGQNGYVCAIENQSTAAEWGCYGVSISGADGTAIGTGNQNTIDIDNGCTTSGIAADICFNLNYNGYSDWFLPSRDEIVEMYNSKEIVNNIITNNSGDLLEGQYWSSTEGSRIQTAVSIDFNNGSVNLQTTRTNNLQVKAIRSF